MRKRGPAKRFEHRAAIRLSADMLARIDEWRRAKALHRCDAMRALIDKALIANGVAEQPGENKTTSRYHGA